VVAHGHGHEQGMRVTVDEVKRGKIVFLLADPKFSVADLYSRLAALSLPLQVAVLENLAYPEERIIVGDIASPPLPQDSLYSLVIGNF
jgi:cobalt-precorrin-7 (C5)-methyltransferase